MRYCSYHCKQYSVALITSAWSSSGIQGLMEDVEDVNKVNYLGQTALHKAASGM